MSQPVWKVLYSTDCERVFIDETGVYSAEMEIAEKVFDAEVGERFIVHRISLARYGVLPQTDMFEEGAAQLVPIGYDPVTYPHPARDYAPWFGKDLPDIAATCGTTVEELIEGLTSAEPGKLASAYRAISGHFGADNFDSYPLDMSEHALGRRWDMQDGRFVVPGPWCAECGERIVPVDEVSGFLHEDPETDEDHTPILDT